MCAAALHFIKYPGFLYEAWKMTPDTPIECGHHQPMFPATHENKSIDIYIYIFRDRNREGEREREKKNKINKVH